MKWASALSTSHNFEKAVRECAAEIKTRLEGASPDLAVVFISPHFSRNFHNAPEAISMALKPAHLIGCSAGGVIGGGIEVENAPALSITAARSQHRRTTSSPDSTMPTPHPLKLAAWQAAPETMDTMLSLSTRKSIRRGSAASLFRVKSRSIPWWLKGAARSGNRFRSPGANGIF